MGTNQCSQPASKSSWDSQDFGDVNMVESDKTTSIYNVSTRVLSKK